MELQDIDDWYEEQKTILSEWYQKTLEESKDKDEAEKEYTKKFNQLNEEYKKKMAKGLKQNAFHERFMAKKRRLLPPWSRNTPFLSDL